MKTAKILYRRHFKQPVPVEVDSTSDPVEPHATKAVPDPPGDPSGSAPATWEFTTCDKQGQAPLSYTVTLRPIRQFGRRSMRYKGVMTHYERMIDNVLGVEGMEASVLVMAQSQMLPIQFVPIFSNYVQVYRSHDDPHDSVKAASAVLRKVLQDKDPRQVPQSIIRRIRQDVFGVVFGSIETMLGVGMSRFRGQHPFPFNERVWKQSESDSGGEAGKTEADNTTARVEPLTLNGWISGWNVDMLAKLMDLGVDIGVLKVK